ncbi:hypothetical protein [Geminocystis sp. NIES-3708]|uniref:hypothetical protein n=1 Tax=Geminocystis sp. NIES-3708 TaxID=1615909 RepID=UPI000836F508|nr:hypothetical protein [Geminocystis sp. NIES-3708]
MNRKIQIINKKLRLSIIIIIPLTILLYLLRGFGLLGFLPGGILIFLIIISAFILISFLITETYS